MAAPLPNLITDFLNAGGSGQEFHQGFLELFDALPNYNLASGSGTIRTHYLGKITDSSTFLGITAFVMEKYLFTVLVEKSKEDEEVADVSIYYKEIEEEDKEAFASIANAETGPVIKSVHVNNDEDEQIVTAVSELLKEAEQAGEETGTTPPVTPPITPDEEETAPPANAGSNTGANTGSGTPSPNTPTEEVVVAPPVTVEEEAEEVIDYSYMVMEKENVVYEQNYLQMREYIYMGNYLSADMADKSVEEIEALLEADSHNWFKVTGDIRFFAHNVKTDVTYIPSVNGKPYYSSGQIWEVAIRAGSVFDHEEGPVRYTITGYNYNDEIDFSYTREYLVADENEAPTDILFRSTDASTGNIITRVGQDVSLGALTGIDPDAVDDGPDGDDENRFGEYDLYIVASSISGFEIVYSETGEARLVYTGQPNALLGETQVSITVRMTDNIGAAADERLSYDETFTFDIDLTPTIKAPEAVKVEEGMNIAFMAAQSISVTDSAGALLDVTISAGDGSFLIRDPIGNHPTQSVYNAVSRKHEITFNNISESELADVLSSLAYIPDTDYYGQDTIEISVSNGIKTVTEDIDVSVIESDSGPIEFKEGVAFSRDYNLGELTFSLVSLRGEFADVTALGQRFGLDEVTLDAEHRTAVFQTGDARFARVQEDDIGGPLPDHTGLGEFNYKGEIWFIYIREGAVFDHEAGPVRHSVILQAARSTSAGYLVAEGYYHIPDSNEAPEDIILTPTQAFAQSSVISTFGGRVNLGVLTGIDPDAADDINGKDAENRFGEFEFTLGEGSHEGFSIVYSETGEASLFFNGDAQALANIASVSAIIVMTDNIGAAAEERLSISETFTYTLDHALELDAPNTLTVNENGDIALANQNISVFGADGELLTVTLSVSHGVLSSTQQNGAISTSASTHTLINISEADLATILSSLVYTPDANYHGSDGLSIAISGDGETISKTIAITITSTNAAPTDIDLAPSADVVNGEFTPTGQQILLGTISGTDIDTGDTHTFTLGTNSDSGLSIVGNLLYFTGDTNLDEISAHIIMTDNEGASYTEAFVFSIHHPFEFTAPQSVSVNEDDSVALSGFTASGGREGALQATLTVTHGLLFNAPASNILDSEATSASAPTSAIGAGVRTLTITALDAQELASIINSITYEPDANYNGADSLVISITGGGATISETINIAIAPVNDAPTDIDLAHSTDVVNGEFTPTGQQILLGTISGTDIDAGDTHTFTLGANSHAGLSIIGNLLYFTGDTNLAEISAHIIMTDNAGASYTEAFTFAVASPLSFTSPDTITVTEDINYEFAADVLAISGVGDDETLSVTITATGGIICGRDTNGVYLIGDPDPSFTYNRLSFDSISAADLSSILSSFIYDPLSNYNGQYAIDVSISDGTTTIEKSISVDITPVNDAPAAMRMHYESTDITPIESQTDAPILVAAVEGIDLDRGFPNPNDPHGDFEITIAAGSHSGFSISRSANTGYYILYFGGTIEDLANIEEVSVTLVMTDNINAPAEERLSISETFTFPITIPNQAPTDIIFTPVPDYADYEIAPPGNIVMLGGIEGIDPDGDSMTYSLGSASHAGFSIDPTVTGGKALCFTGTAQELRGIDEVSAVVIVTDEHGASFAKTFTFTIDHPEPLSISTPDSITIDEDTSTDFAAISIAGGANNQILFATVSVTHGLLFEAVSANPWQTVPFSSTSSAYVYGNSQTSTGRSSYTFTATNVRQLESIIKTLTYEPNDNYNGADSLVISIRSGGETTSETIDINIAPVNDAPTDIIFSPVAAYADYEIAPPGRMVLLGEIVGVDPDGDSMTYTLGSTSHAGFSIDPTATGGKALCFTGTAQELRGIDEVSAVVIATDAHGASYEETFTFTIDHPPEVIVPTSVTIDEDTPFAFPDDEISVSFGGRDVVGLIIAGRGTVTITADIDYIPGIEGDYSDEMFTNPEFFSAPVIDSLEEQANSGGIIFILGVNDSELEEIYDSVVFTPNENYYGDEAVVHFFTVASEHAATTTTDSSYYTSVKTEIRINPVNDAPTGITFTPRIPYADYEIEPVEGRVTLGAIRGTDIDDETLTYTLGSGSSAGLDITGNSLYFNARGENLRGQEEISAVIIATDSAGLTYSETITFTVPEHHAPTDIVFMAYNGYRNNEITPGENLQQLGRLDGIDQDTSILTFTLGAASHSGFSLNVRPGGYAKLEFQGTEEALDGIDEVSAVVIVTDEYGASYEETFTFAIDHPTPLSFTAPDDITVTEDTDYDFATDAFAIAGVSDDTMLTVTISATGGLLMSDGPDVGFYSNFGDRYIIGGADGVGTPFTARTESMSAADLSTLLSTFSYIPAYNFNGLHNISITISDGTTTIAKTIDVDITPVNDAPAISFYSDPDTITITPTDGETPVIFIRGTDFDSSLSWLPNQNDPHGDFEITIGAGSHSGFSIRPFEEWRDGDYGLYFSGTAEELANVDEVSVTLVITDNINAPAEERLTATKTLTFDVEQPNQAPTDIIFTPRTAYADYVIEPAGRMVALGIIQGVDPDGDSMTYSLGSASHSGFSLDDFTDGKALCFVATNANMRGLDEVSAVVIATDAHGATFAKTFTFTIDHPNQAPTDIIFSPRPVYADYEIEPTGNTVLLGGIAGVDPEGDSMVYSLGRASHPGFSLAYGTVLSFNATDRNLNGRDEITAVVIATDEHGLSFEKTFTFTPPPNHAPTDIIFTPNAGYADYEIEVTGQFAYLGSIRGVDPDGDSMTYSLGNESTSGFSINKYSGTLRFDATDRNLEGLDEITAVVIARDEHGATFEKTLTFTVLENQAPTDIIFEPYGLYTDYEIEPTGQLAYLGSIRGVDPDGDRMTYSLASESTPGFSMSGYRKTTLKFNATEENLRGLDEITAVVIATDEHGATFAKTFTFTIDHPNQAPTDITFTPRAAYADYEIEPTGRMVALGIIQGVDPDGDSMTYSLGSASHSGFSLDDFTDGKALCFVATNANMRGIDEVSAVVIATDAHGATFAKTFTFTVPQNQAPTDIIFTPRTAYADYEIEAVGRMVALGDIMGVDPEGDSMTYSLASESTLGFSIDHGSTLCFTATSGSLQGLDEITAIVIATDAHGNTYQEAITFTVSEDNAPTDILFTSEVTHVGYDIVRASYSVGYQKLGVIEGVGSSDDDDFSYKLDRDDSHPGFRLLTRGGETKLYFFVDGIATIHGMDEVSATVIAENDAGISFEKTFTFTIKEPNQDEAPTDIILTPFEDHADYSFLPKETWEVKLATIRTMDPQGGWVELIMGEGSHEGFSVRGWYGKNTLFFKGEPHELEGVNTVSANIVAIDNQGASYEETFTFTVRQNQAPTDIILDISRDIDAYEILPYEYNSHLGSRMYVGYLRGVDPEQGSEGLRFSLVEGSHESFFIQQPSRYGQSTGLRVKTFTNFEGLDEVSAIIMVRDRNGGSFEKTFTFQIDRENEAPHDIIFTPHERYPEYANYIIDPDGGRYTLGSVRGLDVDQDVLKYSLVEGSHSGFFLAYTGRLNFTATEEELQGVDAVSAIIKVTDRHKTSYKKTFTFTINHPLPLSFDVPQSIDVTEDMTSTLSDFTVSGDVGTDTIEATLTVTHGILFWRIPIEPGWQINLTDSATPIGIIEGASITFTVTNTKELSDIINVIQYTPNADYSGADSLVLTLVVGGKTVSETIDINVAAVNDAPTDIEFTPRTNYADYEIDMTGSRVALGTLRGIDPDGDSMTYSLGSESTTGFSVDYGHTLCFTATEENFRGLEEVTAIVIATDRHGATFEKIITFTLPPNEAPTDITFTPSTGYADYEIEPTGQLAYLGRIRGVDPNGDSLVYSFASESTPGFSLDNYNNLTFDTKNISLRGRDEITAIVVVTDTHGLSYKESFTFTIPENDAPTDITFSPQYRFRDYEIVPTGNTVSLGRLEGVDTNGDYLRYTIDSQSTPGFSVSPYNYLRFDATDENLNGRDEVSATVVVTDPYGDSYKETFTFTVGENQAPSDIRFRPWRGYEDYELWIIGHEVALGSIRGIDPDDDRISYSLASESTPGFSINRYINSLRYDATLSNLGGREEITAIVIATDEHGATYRESITFAVSQNQSPTDIIFTRGAAYADGEIPLTGSIVELGTVEGVDPNDGDSMTYSVFGKDGIRGFSLGEDNTLRFFASIRNLEGRDTVGVNVYATDEHGARYMKTFTFNTPEIPDNSAPTDIRFSPYDDYVDYTVASTKGHVRLGTLRAIDPDGGPITYSIDSESTPGFLIDSDRRLRYNATDENLNGRDELTAIVVATDPHGLSYKETFTFTTTGNSAPHDIVFSIREDYRDYEIEQTGRTVTIAQMRGRDFNNDRVTLSLSSESSPGFSLQYGTLLNFHATHRNLEGFDEVTAVVIATDEHGATYKESITFAAPENHAPTDIIVSPGRLDYVNTDTPIERAGYTILVGRVSTVDPDRDSVTVSLGRESTPGFILHNYDKQLEFTATERNLNGLSEATAVIIATDEHGATYSETYTFAVRYNSAPSDITFKPYTDYENYEIMRAGKLVSIGKVKGIDPNRDTVTYSLNSEDSDLGFRLIYNGLYYMATDEFIDGIDEVSAAVIATDEYGASYEETFTFTIDHPNRAPTDIEFTPRIPYADYEIEPAGGRVTLGAIRGTDPDGDTLTYTLGSGSSAGLEIRGNSLYFQATRANMRGQEEISAVITVTDSHGASFEETFTFTIPDENAPTDSVLRLIGDYEIEPVGHKVALGIFKGVNSDGSRMTYSLASESTIGFSIGFHGDNVLYFDATNSKLRGHDELTAIIIATDEQGATYSETITFTVPEPPEDNRAPTDIWFWAWGDYKAHTIEPVENRVTLGTIRSTDPDGDTITYSLGSASHSGFSILTDRRTTELNFQGTAEELRGLDEVSAIVIATDQFGATYSETITFVIPDNKVSPDIVFAPNITFFSVPAFEVPRGGTFVLGYFKGVGGGKSHDDFTYSLGEESHPRFSLRQYENEVGLRFESRLNEWRNDDEVHAVIIATDAEGISYEKTLTFTIPENNAPYNIKLTIPRAYYDDYEAAQIGDTITLGRIQAWDGEQDRLRFSFESGSTPGFSVEYYSPPMLKFDVTEAKRLGLDEITAIITATDIDGASFTKTFTFATHPRAENNAPSDIIFTPFTDYEINPEGRPVTDGSSGEYLGLLEGIDADNGILVYSLSSESTPGFRVSNSGIAFRDDYVAYELTFKATKESLQGLDQATAVVIVTDEYGASYEKTLTFTIPVNDAPTDITFTAATDSTDSFIGTLTTADVDLGDTHTYTLDRASVDAGFSIQGDRVHYTGPATPTVSSVTVTTTDFEGLSYTEIFADIL